jgi:tetratricopeptide (TPR) repeat protein
LANELMMDSETATPLQAVALLVLRRWSARYGAPSPSSTQELGLGRVERPLGKQQDIAWRAARQSVRHAWLALEIALGGEDLWDALSHSYTAAEANIFRQHMATLLDLLSLAGLPDGEGSARRSCIEELRSARQAGLTAVEDLDAFGQAFEFPFRTGAAAEQEAENAEWNVLREVTRALGRAGFPQLAQLIGLRLPRGESLFLEILEYFLRHALRAYPGLGQPDAEEDANETCWRCLETIARLLEERAESVEARLDNLEETLAAGVVPERAQEAVKRLFQQGLSCYHHGDYRQAALHFTAALRLNPNDARVYAYRGDTHRLQCEYERAIADFTLALRLEPSDHSALVSRANAYQCSGEHARAVADCRAALEINPHNATAYRIRAAAHAELGAVDLALADLSAAISLAPEDEETRYQRGVLQVVQRDYARAIADFDHVLKLNAHHVPTYLHRGYARRCLKDYAGALRDYSVVLRYHPSNVPAYAGRGSIYRLMGDMDRAHADYQQALLLEPNNAEVHCSEGILFRIKGDLERAKAALAEAIRLDPQNWPALYHRSKVFLAQGQLSAALADLTAVLSLNPRIVLAYLSRAVIHDRLGQYPEALADATEAVTRDDHSAVARLVRGVANAHLGKRVEAIADLTKAIQLNKRLALAYHERSVLYTLGGEYDRALEDCNQLLALQPGNAQAYAHRSIVYHSKGDLPKALGDYTQAMQLDPRCLMMGLHQGVAESARLQTAQRLAEYIDGLRQEPTAAEPPPPTKFRIVVQPVGVNESALAIPAGTVETASPAAPTPSRRGPRSDEAASLNATMRHKPIPTGQFQLEEKDATKDELAEEIAAQLLSEDESAEEETGLTLHVDTATSDVRKRSVKPKPKTTRPSSPIPVQSPKAPTPKTESTAKKKAADVAGGPPALPSPPTADRNPLNRPLWKPGKQSPKVRQQEEKGETNFLDYLRKPYVLGAVGIAALVLICLSFSFARTDQIRVFPAHGRALLGGKPMPGALIVLEPVWTKDPAFPRPRATVKEDGSFVLGTYKKEDGAPAGEYRVSVQWLLKTKKQEVEGGALPVNVLPSRYSKFETSGLTAVIQAGDNNIPAFQINR